jgi:FADH2 O2-dependent halogenase
VDDAAVHHVFEGGWIWVLRFNNGITSAGVAATDRLADELNFADGAPAWERLLDRLPSVRDLFGSATALFPFIHAPRLAFRSGQVSGARWVLLPSAAGFVDPLLSTGFPLSLLGVKRLGELLEKGGNTLDFGIELEGYASQTLVELDRTAALVGALYANMGNFPRFTALTLLYFAAASYSETARRLKQTELATSFLLGDRKTFSAQFENCLRLANREDRAGDGIDLIRAVGEAIEPLNVAGLADPSRRNWYPTLAEDLLMAAPKLGVTPDQIKALLHECGFFASRGKVKQ